MQGAFMDAEIGDEVNLKMNFQMGCIEKIIFFFAGKRVSNVKN